MTLAQMADLLAANMLNAPAGFETHVVTHIVASDLMSDVLVAPAEDFVLITSLASDQMIRTADLVGASGVVLVNGKQPPASLTRLAKELEMPLLGTALPKFEACMAVGQVLLQETTA